MIHQKTKQIAAELNRLAKQHGGLLRPKDVVDAARAQSSPLHSHFTWDDGEAAEQWRLQQARQLISITMTIEMTPAGEEIVIPAYTSLTPDRKRKGGGYRQTVKVLSNEDWRDQMLQDALAELHAFESKYKMLSELAGVFAAIKKIKVKFLQKAG